MTANSIGCGRKIISMGQTKIFYVSGYFAITGNDEFHTLSVLQFPLLRRLFCETVCATSRGCWMCYATRLSIGRISNRHSLSYSVTGRSSYLPNGKHTMYRRAHSCHQAASSRNVDFGPLFHPHKEGGIRDHRRER